jgi:hypothetical protein
MQDYQNLVVGREGFEPPYSKRTDLQSAGFNHSPIFQGYKKNESLGTSLHRLPGCRFFNHLGVFKAV